MNKFLKIIIAILLFGAIILGIITRSSYVNEISDKNLQNNAIVSFSGVIDENNSKRLHEELLQSDIIIKAVALDEYVFEKMATRCKLKIVDVYKGDVTSGEVINFYLSGFFNKDDNRLAYRGYTVFNHMVPGKEYYVFANKGNHSALYEEIVGKTYVYACVEISWFLTKNTFPNLLDESKEYTYHEIEQNEFNCFSIEQRNFINQFKQNLIKQTIEAK